MRYALVIAVFGFGLGTPVMAQNMLLSIFIPKAEALNKRGMMAMFSSDLKPLMNETNAGFATYRKQLEAERAAHHPSSCPPHPLKVTSDEFMKSLETIPVADRPNMTTTQGVQRFMAQRYPCPK